MWSKLEEVFEETGVEYARLGSYDDEEPLPESFFTFWNKDTPEKAFFDNKAHEAVWVWDIYFFTKDASLLYAKLEDFITMAKEKGFIPQGKPKDIASSEPDYLGRYVQIKYVEKYTNGGMENE